MRGRGGNNNFCCTLLTQVKLITNTDSMVSGLILQKFLNSDVKLFVSNSEFKNQVSNNKTIVSRVYRLII